MRNKRFVGITVLLLGAVFAAQTAMAGKDSESQDRAQIEKLMWHYIRALDTGDAEAYASAFTPDGQFGTGANATKGRDALKKMINDFKTRSAENESKTGVKRAPLYHVIANSYLQFLDKDHARLEAYWMTMAAAGADKTPPRVAGVGREVDELVRVNGQWLIKLRDVAPKD